MNFFEDKWRRIKSYSGRRKVEDKWKEAIIYNVFGGKENLMKLTREVLNSHEVINSPTKLNDYEIAKIVLKSVNTEGYEMRDCLKVARESVRREIKNKQKNDSKYDNEFFKKLSVKAKQDWNREARRGGFKNGKKLEDFLKDN